MAASEWPDEGSSIAHSVTKDTLRCSAHLAIVVYALESIVIIVHTEYVKWEVDLHDEFVPEYGALHNQPVRR